MYLPLVRLTRSLFWMVLASGILCLLLPRYMPVGLPLALAAGFLAAFGLAWWHARRTRRHELCCPHCGWVPFAISAWKCKECGHQWDYFDTEGSCPACRHQHEEAACVRCRKITPNRKWMAKR